MTLIAPIAKAVTGLIVAAVAPMGIDAFTTFGEGVSILVTATLVALSVWFVPNKE